MGIGDAIMTSATIRKAHAKHPDKPICIGPGSRTIWSEAWENLPVSKVITNDCIWIHDYGKRRPYIDYEQSTEKHFHYRTDFKAEPGWIELSKEEKNFPAPEHFIYLEPTVKGSFAGNKDWGLLNWQQVVDKFPLNTFLQGRGHRLDRCMQIETPTIRTAFALLAKAKLFVGTDGALHHAAAALGIPAVVVWGGLTSPRNLGYDTHTNLWSGTKPCGSHESCPHCASALASITPTMVVEAIKAML